MVFTGPGLAAPLCSRHPDDFQLPDEPAGGPDLFTSHDHHEAVERALDTCGLCEQFHPATFDACAKAALTAGTSVDGVLEACASGVVQAGVECRGDLPTWRQLKTAAGEPPADAACEVCGRELDGGRNRAGVCNSCSQVILRHEVVAPAAERFEPPPECVSCNRRMVRTSGPRPDGWVRHAARGQCRRCHRAGERAA